MKSCCFSLDSAVLLGLLKNFGTKKKTPSSKSSVYSLHLFFSPMQSIMYPLRILIAIATLFCCTHSSSLCAAKKITLFNSVPRRDISGRWMDAHDGKVIYLPHEKLYLWAAATYGDCAEPSGPSGCASISQGACGFQVNHSVSVYTSPDLVSWTPAGGVNESAVVFNAAKAGFANPVIMFCPKIIYNRRTKKYLLWMNPTSNGFRDAFYAVAESSSYAGPFVLVNKKVSGLAHNASRVGDFNLLVDKDDVAYIAYTGDIVGGAGPHHRTSVERLNADYTDSTGISSGFFGRSGSEAVAITSFGGHYYVTSGACCCNCQLGGAVYVYRATSSPLGPYTEQPGGPIDDSGSGENSKLSTIVGGRAASTCASSLNNDVSSGVRSSSLRFGKNITWFVPAQQTDIASYFDDEGNEHLMWIGDRWQQAPDGLKGHDPTYWAPLHVDAQGNIAKFPFWSSFEIDVSTP